MPIRSKSLVCVVAVAITLSISCGHKDAESTGTASLPPGISQNLVRKSGAPAYVFDFLGPINYPATHKSNEVSGDTEIVISGWALDESKASLAGGVDVVLDNVPHSARYGIQRADVAAHFNRSDFSNSGFRLALPPGQLAEGQHSVSIRVISNDKKSYTEGPVVQFTVE